MKFKDMPYERVNLDEFKTLAEAMKLRLSHADSAETAASAFEEFEAASVRAATEFELAFIRNSLDTTDEYYAAEQLFCDGVRPLFSEIVQDFTKALLESRFRAELESKWGSVMFLNAEIGLKAFSPEIVPLMQEENKLCTEYDKLLASAQIEFDGKTLTLAQLAPYHQNDDAGVRKASYDARGDWFDGNKARLDSLFDELVKIRGEMARKLGYPNFVQLGYYRMTRNCYDAAKVAKFREGVKRYIVPVVQRLKAEQAKRIGVERLTLYHDAYEFSDGNAKPIGTPEQIFEAGKRMYHELSDDTAQFIDAMLEDELFDVLTRPGKSGGGYCDSLAAYDAEFIFANFNGTSDDIDVLTHEAGHAFAGYCAHGVFPYSLREYTYETAETHSMSMEFLTHPWMELFFGAQTKKYLYSHTASALTFLPYGCMVDEFQHIIYENSDITPDERNKLWAKLESEYRPYLDVSETPFYREGRRWQAQSHIYERPFYYIDYCLAQANALAFWQMDLSDHESAWATYRRFVGYAGTKTFTELVEASGLPDPFEPSTMEHLAETALAWLESNRV